MMFNKLLVVTALLALAGCSGLRTTDASYSAHAENFNILFLQIPGGDTQERALKLVPEGAEIKNIDSSPKDVTSVIGFINRLIGFDFTFINGTIKSTKE